MRRSAYFTTAIANQFGVDNAVCITCSDNSRSADPRIVAKYKCNCRYPWLRELHALTTLMMSNSLLEKIFWVVVIAIAASASIWNTSYIMTQYANHQTTTLIIYKPVKKLVYPTLVFCPKFVDAFNYSAIWTDMTERVRGVSLQMKEDTLIYVMAGSGFDNVDQIRDFSQDYLKELDALYIQWRGNRTVLEMFKFIFEENGYKCESLFKECYSGSQILNCCEIFQPSYVMLRGRCFRLQYPYYQEDVDETDKLQMYFWKPFSPLLGANQLRAQLVLYVGDEHPEVGMFPRYYLGANDWNRLRMVQKRVSMLSNSDRCSENYKSQGKSTCFVRSWLEKTVVDPLNCTLPYFSEMLPYMHGIPVCAPSAIIGAYDNITSPLMSHYNCQPACTRVENECSITSTADASSHPDYSFRIETSFSELEYMEYTEVRSTSMAGFISELGGQSGLFVGVSVITFVQVDYNMASQEFHMNEGLEGGAVNMDKVMRNIWNFIQQFTPENRMPDTRLTPKWDGETIQFIIEKAHELFKVEPLILDLQGHFTAIGPLHGQGDSLISLLSIVGMPPDRQYVFLGNYMGLGFAPFEVLMFVLAMKVANPNHVHMLRGNHEDSQVMTELHITQMLIDRGIDTSTEVFICEALEVMFADMPVAARFPGHVFIMNGGPGPHLREKGLHRLEKIDKNKKENRTLSENLLLMEAMWACLKPKDNADLDASGMPVFNEEEVAKFLEEHDISVFIRGRQLVEEGILNFPRNVLTVSSAVSFLDMFSNCAVALSFDGVNGMIHRYRMNEVEANTLDYAKTGLGRNALH